MNHRDTIASEKELRDSIWNVLVNMQIDSHPEGVDIDYRVDEILAIIKGKED